MCKVYCPFCKCPDRYMEPNIPEYYKLCACPIQIAWCCSECWDSSSRMTLNRRNTVYRKRYRLQLKETKNYKHIHIGSCNSVYQPPYYIQNRILYYED